MPYERANNIAYALLNFSSLPEYEEYRKEIHNDRDCQAALAYAENTRCIISYERGFMRPVFE